MNEHLHLKWDGPTAFGFDERERMEFAKIHRQVRNTLSRRKKNNSLRSLQQQQISIENMLNNALMTLDLHSAALRYDKRNLHNVNIGIAEYIVDSSSQVEQYEMESKEAIEEHMTKIKNAEEEKKQKFNNELEPLEKKLKEKNEKAKKLEEKAKEYKTQAEQKQQRIQRFEEYKEWTELNNEYNRLCDEAVKLERAIQRQKSQNKFENKQAKFF